MRTIFVDTSYHIAVIDTRDQHHVLALATGESLRRENVTFVTTDSVLVEFLTFLSGHGERIRLAAAKYIDVVRTEASFTVVSQTRELFDAGLELYRSRPDKGYSMTDCMSMVVCTESGITDVLTYDHDFVQEGFRALMRGDNAT